MSTVSVVIPTYNRAATIERAIVSALRQTHSPLEVLVVDDASTDDTVAVLSRLEDPRLRLIRRESNGGGSRARNDGIAAARGEFIAFQDSDDVWLPRKLEQQMALFDSAPPSVGVIYSAFWRVEDEEKHYRPERHAEGGPEIVLPALLQGNFVTTQSAVVRRRCLEESGGFDEALPQYQDWELFLRLARRVDFRFIPEPLVVVMATAGSLSARNSTRAPALRHIIETHEDLFAGDHRLFSHYQYLLGSWLCLADQTTEGRRHLVAALRNDPLRLRNLAALGLSFMGSPVFRWATRIRGQDPIVDEGDRP